MAANHLGLGKGLDALIRETGTARDTAGVQSLPIKDIVPNPNQPRRKFTEKALEELAASIRSQGLLQPILVRPLGDAHPGKFEIVAGERRWRACKMAGLTEVPVLVRTFSAQETLAAALIENLQREDLNPVEEALGIQTLKEEFGLSQEDLAQRLGKSRSAVANSLRLLALPESFRNDLIDGRLSAGHARALLSVNSTRGQEYLRNLILEESLSVREAEGLASTWKDTGEFRPEGVLSSQVELGGADGGEALSETGGGPTGKADPAHAQAEAAPGGSAEKESTPRRRKPQSARLLEIQSHIGEVLSVPVRVTGKETKGKISLSFSSRAELESLLNKLALLVGPSAGRDVLTGRNLAKLDADGAMPLDQSHNTALPYTAHPPLSPFPAKPRAAIGMSPEPSAVAEAAAQVPDPSKSSQSRGGA